MTKEEALKLMCEYCKHYDICLGTGCTLRSFLEDTAEVVRCYQCKFCVKDPCDYEFPYCAEHSMYVQLEDYCSYGEVKGDTE